MVVIRGNLRHLYRAACAVCALAAIAVGPGCKKKEPAVEAVTPGGKKPPVVGRKPKADASEAAKAAEVARAVDPAKAEAGARPPPPAEPAGVAAPPADRKSVV